MFLERTTLPAPTEEADVDTLRPWQVTSSPLSYPQPLPANDHTPFEFHSPDTNISTPLNTDSEPPIFSLSLTRRAIFPSLPKEEREPFIDDWTQELAYRVSQTRKLRAEVDNNPNDINNQRRVNHFPETQWQLSRNDWRLAQTYVLNPDAELEFEQDEARLQAGIRDNRWEDHVDFDRFFRT